ncbi:MAG: hypothetical protein AVDCRST_MAG73-2354, partial [uncultured Thermomicrobiales bacterium]
ALRRMGGWDANGGAGERFRLRPAATGGAGVWRLLAPVGSAAGGWVDPAPAGRGPLGDRLGDRRRRLRPTAAVAAQLRLRGRPQWPGRHLRQTRPRPAGRGSDRESAGDRARCRPGVPADRLGHPRLVRRQCAVGQPGLAARAGRPPVDAVGRAQPDAARQDGGDVRRPV